MLVELEVHVKAVRCPVVRRLFFDTESGGLSTMPVMAERGQDKDSALAKQIAHELKRDPVYLAKAE